MPQNNLPLGGEKHSHFPHLTRRLWSILRLSLALILALLLGYIAYPRMGAQADTAAGPLSAPNLSPTRRPTKTPLPPTSTPAWTPTPVATQAPPPTSTPDATPTPLPTSPPDRPGYTLTFYDEFSGTSLDRSLWNSTWYNGGGGELQEYVDDDSHGNYVVSGGTLKITARQESYQGKNYTSGVIASDGVFSQTYGYFVARARNPVGKGYWPAFWLRPFNRNVWPPEVDVMEALGANNRIYQTYHYGTASMPLKVAPNGGMGYTGGNNYNTAFHDFAVDWLPTGITYTVDGIVSFVVLTPSIVTAVPMAIFANLAVGGSWPGSPDATTVFPADFELDYVRVYQINVLLPAP